MMMVLQGERLVSEREDECKRAMMARRSTDLVKDKEEWDEDNEGLQRRGRGQHGGKEKCCCTSDLKE